MNIKYLIRALYFVSLIFIIDVAMGFINDPYMVFHKPWIHDKYYFKDMRKQAIGIINTHEFDSIILGTSKTQNTSFKEASSVFNSNFVNLSIGGGLISERAILLNHILKNKKIKNVIITLDVFGNYGEYRPNNEIKGYSYLYDDSIYNNIKLYLGFKKVGLLFCGNFLFHNNCPFTVTELSMATEWFSDKNNNRRFGGIEKWLNYSNDPQIRSALIGLISQVESKEISLDNARIVKAISNDQKVYSEYILKYVNSYPETNFYLFFPPHHRLKHKIWKQSDPAQNIIYKARIESIVKLSEPYNNVKIFGYDNFPFVDDISNYKDTGHYHPRFDSKILYWMKSNTGLLKVATLESYFADFDQKINEYDAQNIVDLIKKKFEKDGI